MKGKSNSNNRAEKSMKAGSLKSVLPAGYVKLVQKDLKKRRKHVYSASMISMVANGATDSVEVMESIVNVIDAERMRKSAIDKKVKKLLSPVGVEKQLRKQYAS